MTVFSYTYTAKNIAGQDIEISIVDHDGVSSTQIFRVGTSIRGLTGHAVGMLRRYEALGAIQITSESRELGRKEPVFWQKEGF